MSGLPISPKLVSLGPNVCQFICYLNVILNLSFEKTRGLIKDLADIEVSDGEISNVLAKQSKLLLPHYYQLLDNIRAGPASHYDETSWQVQKEEQGRFAWVMTGTKSQETIFRLG